MKRFLKIPCKKCGEPISDRPDRRTPYCLKCVSSNRCDDCGQIRPIDGDHVCNGVDVRGERNCLDCKRVLKNDTSERWKKYCTTCAAKRAKPAQRKRREGFVKDHGGKCGRCGYDRCSAALHFHHKDSSEKYLYSKSGHLTVRELTEHPERFELLCANCHIEEHQPEFIKGSDIHRWVDAEIAAPRLDLAA